MDFRQMVLWKTSVMINLDEQIISNSKLNEFKVKILKCIDINTYKNISLIDTTNLYDVDEIRNRIAKYCGF